MAEPFQEPLTAEPSAPEVVSVQPVGTGAADARRETRFPSWRDVVECACQLLDLHPLPSIDPEDLAVAVFIELLEKPSLARGSQKGVAKAGDEAVRRDIRR